MIWYFLRQCWSSPVTCPSNLTSADRYPRLPLHDCLLIFIRFVSVSSAVWENLSPHPPLLHSLPPPSLPPWSRWILNFEMFLCCIDFCFHFREAHTASTPLRVCVFASTHSPSLRLFCWFTRLVHSLCVRTIVNQSDGGQEVKGYDACYIILIWNCSSR